MAVYSDLQLIKREFFSMRNGVIADTLRRGGSPHRIIFGLTLPQLNDIARAIGENRGLAERLWENSTTRESQMLAPMIFPRSEMDRPTAMLWITQSQSAEVIDILCMKLLRHCGFAKELASELSKSEDPMMRYAALRLYFNLLPENLSEAKSLAEKEIESDCRQTRVIAHQLLEEIEFLMDEETGEE